MQGCLPVEMPDGETLYRCQGDLIAPNPQNAGLEEAVETGHGVARCSCT